MIGRSCFIFDIEKRATIDQLLSHKYLAEVKSKYAEAYNYGNLRYIKC